MTCGIYILRFKGSDSVYIGQAVNIERRISSHKTKLKGGASSIKLQDAYNRYGPFTYEILTECLEHELDNLEELMISKYDSYNSGLNSRNKVCNGKGLVGDSHPGSKFDNDTIIEIFYYLTEMPELLYQEIADITETNVSLVRDINLGKRHTWLSDKFPEKYTQLNTTNRLVTRNTVANGKVYPAIINDKTGEIISNITNISEIARAYNLSNSHLNEVLNGKAKSTKGWSLVVESND